mmetsp:Transcript_82051/g.254721  ORF Transcript_82051/g.254721 Transcript_82051/m.254721 type:complete len:214 (+) Transcript_82051:348-989(+)
MRAGDEGCVEERRAEAPEQRQGLGAPRGPARDEPGDPQEAGADARIRPPDVVQRAGVEGYHQSVVHHVVLPNKLRHADGKLRRAVHVFGFDQDLHSKPPRKGHSLVQRGHPHGGGLPEGEPLQLRQGELRHERVGSLPVLQAPPDSRVVEDNGDAVLCESGVQLEAVSALGYCVFKCFQCVFRRRALSNGLTTAAASMPDEQLAPKQKWSTFG